MLKELIELGKWLDHEKNDDFGKNIDVDKDYLFEIKYDVNKGFYFNKRIININGHYAENNDCYVHSIYSKYPFIETNQNFMYQSNSNLGGISPFLLKINDFSEKEFDEFYKNPDEFKESCNKNNVCLFLSKSKSSYNSNFNNSSFIELFSEIYNNKNDFFSKISVSDNELNNLKTFFEEYSFEDVKKIIIDFYKWICENKDNIIKNISDYKKGENYEKGVFYLVCFFGNELDMLNDICYYYSKFIKKRNKKFKEIKNAKCSFCEYKGNVYPSLGNFSFNAPFMFNYDDKNNVLNNSRIKFCKKCSVFSILAEDKLKKTFSNNIIILPKKINPNADYKYFFKEINKEENPSFERINNLLENFDGFNYDLILYKKETQPKGSYVIEKYVENYKSYLSRVKDNEKENYIKLYDDNDNLEYLSFNKKVKHNKSEFPLINNIFNFEWIFKEFFIKVSNNQPKNLSKFKYLYQIYTRDLGGKSGIINDLDVKTFNIFLKYKDALFNFIYELQIDNINKHMINEIVLNCIIFLIKNIKVTDKKSFVKLKYSILKRLNYYLMLNKEILGDYNLGNEEIIKLKEYVAEYKKDDWEYFEKISELVNKEPYLNYYLIGKFLKLIDAKKFYANKKGEIFKNFVVNSNMNNVKNLFAIEVLQKNIFYIQKMGYKGKLIFNLIEQNLNNIFVFDEKDGFSFEDCLIAIITGYFTENILKTEKDEVDSYE